MLRLDVANESRIRNGALLKDAIPTFCLTSTRTARVLYLGGGVLLRIETEPMHNAMARSDSLEMP